MGNYSGLEMYLLNIEKNLNEIRDFNKSANGKRYFNEYEERMDEFKKSFQTLRKKLVNLIVMLLN
ncbi:hypothetical protein [Carnobacterium maltaromaticum]|uniref:hypothetical protein n=1 Tax=Carnobacterium maltaromaticum TaxID=2751 RepID=UPI00295E4090|nr:hypothetical protein [Carnobacterium maltaromaticum]